MDRCTHWVPVFARVALKRAEVLLKMKHGMVRLDAVWGVGGGRRPVKVLINKVHSLCVEQCIHGCLLVCIERCIPPLQ